MKLNPVSFLLLVGALAGNATIADIDIFLILSVPIFILILFQQLRSGESFKPAILAIFLAISPIVYFAFRAPEVGIRYYDYYDLWPLKTGLLALFLIFQKGEPWPIINDYLLCGLILILLLSGQIEQGRFVSLFGPNMLYRFFGALFLIALIRAGSTKGFVRSVAVIMSGIGMFGMSLTGSVGTVPLILCSLFFARKSLLELAKGHGGPIAFFAAIALLYQFRGFFSENLVSRVQYKLDNIDGDERLFTWRRLIDTDPGWFGLDYNRFANIWTLRIPYPHNMFVELWAFYGYLGFSFALFTVFAYLASRDSRYYFYFVSVVIFIGAMLSGDLSDNFAVLSFPIVFLVARKQFTGRLTQTISPHRYRPRVIQTPRYSYGR